MNLREDKHWSYGVVHLPARCEGPASVRGLRAGADRQDQGSAGRAAQGAARHPERSARRRRRRSRGPSRSSRSRCRATGRPWAPSRAVSRTSSPSVSTTATTTPMADQVRAQDRRHGHGGGQGGHPPRPAGLGRGGRPVQDRSGHPGAETGRDQVHRRGRQAVRRLVRGAWAVLIGAILLLPSEAAAQRRTRRGSSACRSRPGRASGRNFENNSWMVGGQLAASLGKTFELRPSGDMYLKRGEKMAWQLNGDAAIRFGDDGSFYAGGGIAWLHPPDVDPQTGYNVFLGLNSAAPWEKARGFHRGSLDPRERQHGLPTRVRRPIQVVTRRRS